ncbi:MAG: hypothetical protein Tsb0013_24010 [Phycisphaerales bacterium]
MAHTRSILLLLLACLYAVCMGACRTMSDSSQAQLHTPDDPTALVAFDIENFRGSVELRVDPARADIEVQAHAHGAWFRDDPEAESEALRAITLEADLEETDGRAVMRIRTDSSRAQNDHEVALIVYTPRCDGARVRNFGGLVELIGTAGTIDIENIEGHVEVRTNQPLTQDATVLVTDGTVYFQIPPGSTGAFDLETLEGTARFKNRVGDATNTYSTQTLVQTILEEPTNAVTLRTNRGDLRVIVMDDPESLTRVVRGRTIDLDEGLFLQGSRRYTRNLPDDEPRENPPG